MEAAIHCLGLSKRFGAVVALENLDLEVPVGSIFGLLGPNGAGKTTLTRLLTGLMRPTAGQATVAGQDISQGSLALHQHIGALDQHPQFYNWMRGRELLTFVGELFGLRGPALRARVDEMLAATGLTGAAHRRIGGYSGGMRQRLGLAQALINRPAVLFLDEPVSALDPEGRHDLLHTIAGLRGSATVLMSTHILADVERVCDHVAIINKGRLIVSSTVEALQQRYAQPVFLLEPASGQDGATAACVADFQHQPWCQDVAIEHGTIRVNAHDALAASREMLPLVAAHGLQLQRFERGRPSVEDIFLRLVAQQPDPEALR